MLGVLAFLVIAALAIFGGALFYGWIAMLLLGVTHHELGWPVDPVGFWPSMAIGLLFSILTGGAAQGGRD